jgi:hypothetical protein
MRREGAVRCALRSRGCTPSAHSSRVESTGWPPPPTRPNAVWATINCQLIGAAPVLRPLLRERRAGLRSRMRRCVGTGHHYAPVDWDGRLAHGVTEARLVVAIGELAETPRRRAASAENALFRGFRASKQEFSLLVCYATFLERVSCSCSPGNPSCASHTRPRAR